MIVELANKFRFEVDDIQEVVNANKMPSLHLRATKNIGTLTANTIIKNFDGKTLSSIKIFENIDSKVPIYTFTDYDTLAHFENSFSGPTGTITIILSMDMTKLEAKMNPTK